MKILLKFFYGFSLGLICIPTLLFLLTASVLTMIGECGKLVDRTANYLFRDITNYLYEEIVK